MKNTVGELSGGANVERPLVFGSVPAAAKWAGVPIYTLRQAIRESSVRHVRRGRTILVTSTALLEWLGEGR